MYQSWTETFYDSDKRTVENGVKNLRVDSQVHLKIGARVLCLQNLDVEHVIANGTPAVVIGFYPTEVSKKEIRELMQGKQVALPVTEQIDTPSDADHLIRKYDMEHSGDSPDSPSNRNEDPESAGKRLLEQASGYLELISQ